MAKLELFLNDNEVLNSGTIICRNHEEAKFRFTSIDNVSFAMTFQFIDQELADPSVISRVVEGSIDGVVEFTNFNNPLGIMATLSNVCLIDGFTIHLNVAIYSHDDRSKVIHYTWMKGVAR